MPRDHAGKTDQPPARLVAIAAIDRVGEHAFHHALIQRGPERANRQAIVESDLGRGEADEHLFPLPFIESVECLPIGLGAMGICRLDAGAIELRRRERQLVTLTRHARLPPPFHLDAAAPAPPPPPRARDEENNTPVRAPPRPPLRRAPPLHPTRSPQTTPPPAQT